MKRKFFTKDLVGKKFNSWIFVKELKNNTRKGLFKCECGIIKHLYLYSVFKGLSKNCGCLRGGKIKKWKPIYKKNYIMIPLTRGYYSVIDKRKDFLDKIKIFSWYVSSVDKSSKYAVSGFTKNGIKTRVNMHRILLGIKNKNIHVDHIDGDGLNNRLNNLRLCNRNQNCHNSKPRRKNWPKGVYFCKSSKNPYRSQITVNSKKIYLGCFKTKLEAANAYDEAAIKYHKEFANLNFKGDRNAL